MTATITAKGRGSGFVVQSLSMVLSTAINAGFGMVFWIVAARIYASTDVGVASAVVSGISLILGVGQLGLPLALPRLLPSMRDHARALIATTYAMAVALSTIAGALFVLIARHIDGIAALFHSTGFSLWFVASAPCCVIFAVQDFVLCGLHRASWTPPENLAYSVGRFVLLGALVSAGASGLYLAWTIPAAAASCVVTWLLFRRLLAPEAAGAAREGIQRLDRRFVAAMISSDYIGSLAQTAAVRILPLLIVASLGTMSSAYFYVAWTVMFAVDTVVANVVTAATVDGANDRARMSANVEALLRKGGSVLVVGVLLLVVGARPVLGVFSGEYRLATGCLQLLAISLLPRFILLVTAAVARHERRPRRIIVLQVLPAVLTVLGAAIAVQHGGITAVAAMYVLAQVVAVAACGHLLWQWLVEA